ncbi:ATP-binding protein [Campylobacter sp. CLAX-7218-21]|uniref:AAA family ATPase n=1 Tax=Campylobacter devanensis TaxID=3161138 RepID=UPI002EBAE621|nr:ATP-binding protein [Campylobacter sp. CLAX-7218-21]
MNTQKYKDEEHNTEIENNLIELIARTNHFKQDNKTIKSFPLESESDGTQEFLKLIGPFIDAMENNYIVVIDELEAHLHPKIAQFIVDMFNSQEVKNESCAQLIFTTHNTNLLNKNIFRKDQIYFCEKQNKATKLYSLFDFKTTNDNWELNYLLGRYGGIPNITNFVY